MCHYGKQILSFLIAAVFCVLNPILSYNVCRTCSDSTGVLLSLCYLHCLYKDFYSIVGYNLNNWPGAADKTKPQELTWTHSGLFFLLSVSTVIKVLL